MNLKVTGILVIVEKPRNDFKEPGKETGKADD